MRVASMGLSKSFLLITVSELCVAGVLAQRPRLKRRSCMHKLSAQNVLTGTELNHGELESVLTLAETLKSERAQGKMRTDLAGKHVALVFDKPSLRTRVSFTVAVEELGGQVIEVASGNRKTEEPEDSIRVLEGYVHAAMVRTFEHSILERMASKARIPLVNGLCD